MGTDNDHKGREEEGLIAAMSEHHLLTRKNTTPREAAASLLSSYFSKRFMSGWYELALLLKLSRLLKESIFPDYSQ